MCLAVWTILIAPGAIGQIAVERRSEQPAGKNPQRGADRAPRGRGKSSGGRVETFHTEVPAHPFDIVLVRPTRNSMTVSVVAYADEEGSIACWQAGREGMNSTPVQALPAGEPVLFKLEHLKADSTYRYRLNHRPRRTNTLRGDGPAAPSNNVAMSGSDTYSFHTPRASDEAFKFTIQADSHLDANMSPAVYEQTLANALADKPDFHIDLGDTFMCDKHGRSFADALPLYIAQRYYFGQLCHSASLFMVLGNHDGELGYTNDGPASMAAWSFAQRTKYFPPPEIIDNADGIALYSGRTSYEKGQGANYYEFTWGDAQFFVLDPFWFTTTRPRGGGGHGRDKKDADVAGTDENWARTLGKDQYDWLARKLEGSKAKYKFVFIHHLVGGLGKANRGGVESSVFFEWGGKNADGSAGFASHRPGWAMPIHDLLVKHKVSAVFHGHDHLFVRSERDGMIYQCVPQPGNPRGGTQSAGEYGYSSGTILGSPGHLRVAVSPSSAKVEFIRASIGDDKRPARNGPGANGSVVTQYEIKPRIRR